ncbi:MAG: PKD domain-containing protein, partial [Bacteroidota bacterium]
MTNPVKITLYFCILALLASCSRPMANFSYNPDGAKAPAKVQFSNESKKAESYEWDFGDGQKSTEESPEHRYTSSGSFNVILKATKGEKSTTKSKIVNVKPTENCMVEIETEFGTMTVLLSDATPGGHFYITTGLL